MKRIIIFALCALSILISGCATTEFSSYETKDNKVFEGKGGSKVVVDGIDFWENGDPPRRFKVLGFIDDGRLQHVVMMASIRSDIAKKAKEVGADAIIPAGTQSQVWGGEGAPKMNRAKFIAIKYLD